MLKLSLFVPIDKKTDDKYVMSNYSPGSLLNGFSKIYEIHSTYRGMEKISRQ